MERVAVDTSLLIDLQNERRGRGAARGAIDFLRRHASAQLLLPVVALGEYLEGFDDPAGAEAYSLVAGMELLPVTRGVATRYAMAAREMRAGGRLAGSNDLWIACSALEAGLPLVTRNAQHFARLKGLEVLTYNARGAE